LITNVIVQQTAIGQLLEYHGTVEPVNYLEGID